MYNNIQHGKDWEKSLTIYLTFESAAACESYLATYFLALSELQFGEYSQAATGISKQMVFAQFDLNLGIGIDAFEGSNEANIIFVQFADD